jgi:hypothetical protein
MMVEGELIQLDRIGRIGITEADCMELVDRKTACLFSACAKLGAVAAGADTQFEEKLGEFAWNLGMAFQLIDDMLDFTSREQTLGKPVGGDLKEGKVTLPLVYALETATPAERAHGGKGADGNAITMPCRSPIFSPWWSAIPAFSERGNAPSSSPIMPGRSSRSSRRIRISARLFTLTDLVTARDR